ncbi:DNA polymerase III subunit delta' [Shewanella sp. NIFS-20-20]|uniref:DNA polymerase III subunit delta' n=1 Tax=Shewanella sp. NIFS-20-20 TaxID=2853806 RepID=UPI001C4872C0|nr:DNA polymerase III subunit delta' [Shewanella sp. NIFS-20-20]MBV7314598.1 DNA polymerase III subunit delta' [Shewanella sp. NIFS-20-20]
MLTPLLPWCLDALTQFSRAKQQGTLAHAMLLALDDGFGADNLVRHLAQAALCTDVQADGACGQCKSCQLFSAGNHPDFYEVHVDGQQIKVDQIRSLCQRLTQTAQQGGYRVAVIFGAERMNNAAANALLKTLEEPGNQTLLLLQANRLGQLLPTIRSRCQRVMVQEPSRVQIRTWLEAQEQLSFDPCWCLPIVGGPIALQQSLKDDRYQTLISLRNGWQQALRHGHIHAPFQSLIEQHMLDALGVLYLVCRQSLLKNHQLSLGQRVAVSELAARVMTIKQQLMSMSNVNSLALCQDFVLEYNKVMEY